MVMLHVPLPQCSGLCQRCCHERRRCAHVLKLGGVMEEWAVECGRCVGGGGAQFCQMHLPRLLLCVAEQPVEPSVGLHHPAGGHSRREGGRGKYPNA
eukprot:scaffold118090_cov29-Tisochrysis_lutea.AAC.4